MEITSLGLLSNGTSDLETEGGRTSSRATGPGTERASATTDSWSIARVAPAATAGCGSTGKPGAALGERAHDDAYQVARSHRPEWHGGPGECCAVRGPERDRIRGCDTNSRQRGAARGPGRDRLRGCDTNSRQRGAARGPGRDRLPGCDTNSRQRGAARGPGRDRLRECDTNSRQRGARADSQHQSQIYFWWYCFLLFPCPRVNADLDDDGSSPGLCLAATGGRGR